jgi:hypothetical protein
LAFFTVGRYQSWGEWRDTPCMDIVTKEVKKDGVWRKLLKSAYPISPSRRLEPEGDHKGQ